MKAQPTLRGLAVTPLHITNIGRRNRPAHRTHPLNPPDMHSPLAERAASRATFLRQFGSQHPGSLDAIKTVLG